MDETNKNCSQQTEKLNKVKTDIGKSEDAKIKNIIKEQEIKHNDKKLNNMMEGIAQIITEIIEIRDSHFIGHQNDPEYFLRRSKLFILTSLSEGIPTAMTEAMACGLPAVVSEVGDITDLAVEGVTAKVVQYPYRAEKAPDP